MKALFVFGHKFIRRADKVYSRGQFPYAAWERYLRHFDDLTVFARELVSGSQSSPGELNRSDGPDVSFELIPEETSLTGRVFRPAKSYARVQSLISEADAVILRNGPLAWQAARLAERLSTPWAIEVTVEVWEAYWHYGSMAAKLYAPLAEVLSKYWVARAPFALYVTENALQNRYPCDGVTAAISNAMIPHPENSVIKNRLTQIRENSKPIIFGFAGSIGNESKGLREAFHALRDVQSELPEYQFRIIGPGDSSRWEELASRLDIRSNVRFSGLLPAGQPVLEWMEDIDVYLHPSLREGLPRSVIEAMSRGCPVLASRTGGIPELLPDEVLHEPGDWRTLAHHITNCALDQNWQINNAVRNFEVSKNYSTAKLRRKRESFWSNFSRFVKSVS